MDLLLVLIVVLLLVGGGGGLYWGMSVVGPVGLILVVCVVCYLIFDYRARRSG